MTGPGPVCSGNPDLLRHLIDEIRSQGPLTFARFMDQALHHPEWGYYARGAQRIGEDGDFITASDLGSAFGRTFARQVAEIDHTLARPTPFNLVEFGAGRGWLGRDISAAIKTASDGLDQRLAYTAVDASPAMRDSIVDTVPDARVAAADESLNETEGCALAMELFDALPVHRVVRRDGKLIELGVGETAAELHVVEMRPSPQVEAWAERYGAAATEGHEAEVCLALQPQFERLDRAIRRGVVLVLDYGDLASSLYSDARAQGTLLAYHRHRTNEDYLTRVGEQDLTAHVNFSALEDAATALGWTRIGWTTQDRFLIANGILEIFESMDDAAYRDPQEIERRWKIKRLIEPGGMGRQFRVMAFCKGLDPLPDLAGFADPFAR